MRTYNNTKKPSQKKMRRRLIQFVTCVIFLTGLLADSQIATAQLFRRFRQQLQSQQQQQYRAAQSRAQVVQPTQPATQPNVQVVQPNVQAIQSNQVQVDPRTQQVVPSGAGVASNAVQSIRLPLYRDARTGKLVAVDPRTGRFVSNLSLIHI